MRYFRKVFLGWDRFLCDLANDGFFANRYRDHLIWKHLIMDNNEVNFLYTADYVEGGQIVSSIDFWAMQPTRQFFDVH